MNREEINKVYNDPEYQRLINEIRNHKTAIGRLIEEIIAKFPLPKGDLYNDPHWLIGMGDIPVVDTNTD